MTTLYKILPYVVYAFSLADCEETISHVGKGHAAGNGDTF